MKISVKVKPQSKEEKIVKLSDSEYEISVKEPAREGKANLRLLKLLSKEFKGKKFKIKNPSSRKKIVEVSD